MQLATSQGSKAMKICYGHICLIIYTAKILISFDSVMTVLKHSSNQGILKICDITALLHVDR